MEIPYLFEGGNDVKFYRINVSGEVFTYMVKIIRNSNNWITGVRHVSFRYDWGVDDNGFVTSVPSEVFVYPITKQEEFCNLFSLLKYLNKTNITKHNPVESLTKATLFSCT